MEVAGYEGQTNGAWLCGPTFSARYGGLAAQVRHSERRPDRQNGMGTTILAGMTVVGQRVRTEALDPKDAVDEETAAEFATPHTGTHVMGAGHLRVGHHWRMLGFELGGIVAGDRVDGSGINVLPQGELTIGPRDVFYVLGGAGVTQLTAMREFGYPYFGLGLPLGSTKLEARMAFDWRMVPVQSRGDVFWVVPIDDRLSLRAGLSLGYIADWTREASLGCVLHL